MQLLYLYFILPEIVHLAIVQPYTPRQPKGHSSTTHNLLNCKHIQEPQGETDVHCDTNRKFRQIVMVMYTLYKHLI